MANQKTSESSTKKNTAKKAAEKKNASAGMKKKGRQSTTRQVTIDATVIDKAKIESVKEIVLWVTLALCILLFLSNVGIGGMIGNAVSGCLFGIFGLIAYLFPLLLLTGTFFMVSNYGNHIAMVKLVAGVVFTLFLCVLIELITHGSAAVGAMRAYYYGVEHKGGGGFLGGGIAQGLYQGFGLIGAYVITLLVMIIAFILITEKSLLTHMGGRRSARRPLEYMEKERQERQKRIRQDRLAQEAFGQAEGPRRMRKISGVAFDTAMTEGDSGKEKKREELCEVRMHPSQEVEVTEVRRVPLHSDASESPADRKPQSTSQKPSSSRDTAKKKLHISMAEDAPAVLKQEEPEGAKEQEKSRRTRKTAASTNEMLDCAHEVADAVAKGQSREISEYHFPPLSLLKKKKASSGGSTKAELNRTAEKLEQTLRNFGIQVTVTEVTCGPTVTRYELLPEVGVRVNRITNLADDIKLNLAVTDIRIEAPIPGKAAVGIEVPNKEKVMVSFEELASSKEFQEAVSKVSFCVGRDIAGNVITANIAKMPHLLIAGTTGSGKSVCINTIIMSILYKASPDEVKLIMIDPKVVELSIYNGIPHLLIPVVTDPKKAAGALHWAVTEMDDRYQKFADAGVRDIRSYNAKLVKNNYQMPINSNGETAQFEKMPEMVVIVDELADLMMVAAKEVEESICRLAQKARAAGIYLILATQRPSVDVVTGLIKANMPSRIAFAVKSGVDSRTILDMFGAEKLLGNGDMLYAPQSITKPLRVQGAFVSDSEVQDVVDYIRENNVQAAYNEKISQVISSGAEAGNGSAATGGGNGYDDGVDSYFAEAGRLIISKEKGSIGMLQRNFKIGFNRAARIMDQLEEAGVVGPELGTKPRTVLMTPEAFEIYLNPDAAQSIQEEYPVDESFD